MTWVAEGSLEEESAEITWIDENRSLFSRSHSSTWADKTE
jgi:hypothetical protein